MKFQLQRSWPRYAPPLLQHTAPHALGSDSRNDAESSCVRRACGPAAGLSLRAVALDILFTMPPCYDHSRGLNLEGPWPSGTEQLCAHRYMTLAEAQAACSDEPKCDGVTIDGGVECVVERSEYTSSYPDGLKWKLPYSCRSKPTKQWGTHTNIASWLKRKDSTCDPATSAPAVCPLRAVAALQAHAPKGDAPEDEHQPRALARAAELERLSALETMAIDGGEVARGICPRDVSLDTSPPPIGTAALPTSCGGRVSLLEQLATLATLPGGHADDCSAQAQHKCMLTHNGRKDGWGGQHFRRVRTLLSAVQLGCAYVHAPLFPMKCASPPHPTHTCARACSLHPICTSDAAVLLPSAPLMRLSFSHLHLCCGCPSPICTSDAAVLLPSAPIILHTISL